MAESRSTSPNGPRLLETIRSTSPRRDASATGLVVSMQQLRDMTGREFEKYLSDLFTAHGFNVNLTPESRDKGADLTMVGPDGARWVVQAKKRWGRRIGVVAVQEVFLAKFLYGADRAVIVTNAEFTSDVTPLVREIRSKTKIDIELWSGDVLMQAIKVLTWDGSLPTPKTPGSPSTPDCPKCKGPMVQRTNSLDQSQFFGCPRFPICNGRRPLSDARRQAEAGSGCS